MVSFDLRCEGVIMFLYTADVYNTIVYVDIDECFIGGHNCTQNQRCVNRPGNYECICVSGYELSNGNCEGNSLHT